jgi:hypothetical protein
MIQCGVGGGFEIPLQAEVYKNQQMRITNY